MALMIPYHAMNSSEGEDAVFNALRSGIDDNYMVFYSVKWVGASSNPKGRLTYLYFTGA